MRKPFLLSLLVALLTTLSTHAYDFQSGDLYYYITSYTTVQVTGGDYSTLATATIPSTVTYNGTTYSVTSIGDDAFENCYSLTSITIPNSVTSIGGMAFYNCSALTSVTLGTSVTSIGGGAFNGCSSLTSITLPNSVTSIGDGAFEYCSSLTSITIPNSVTSIGVGAFENCSSLTSITIGNSVTNIGWGAFSDCSSLTSIVVESGNTMYDSRENCNAIIETASNTLIAGCQSTTIPNSVTGIGYLAFRGCSTLTSVTLPNSVTSIGYAAFADCSKLADIYCYATTPPMCNNNTFDGVSKNCYIHVPAGTIRDYQLATGWDEFIYYYEIEEEEQAIQTTEQQNKPSRKIIRDGQVLILRNGVAYDMMGNTL